MSKENDPTADLLITARKQQILDAATKVFAEKGFHRATIKEIAKAAGVADGTIYNYFTNKTELLLGILNRLNETEQREQHFVAGSEQDIRSFFVAYLRQRLALLWPNLEVFRAILPELLVNAELRDMYYSQVIEPTFTIGEHFLQAQIEQKQSSTIDIPLTARAIASTVLGLLVMQLLGDTQLATRWQELPEVLATLIFDGLQSYLKQAKGEK
jgi:TetR/AcrR family fatty acid metabolism transcriptional regulator